MKISGTTFAAFGFTFYILWRRYLLFAAPGPLSMPRWVLFFHGGACVLIALYFWNLQAEYTALVVGILIIEILARFFSLKPLLWVEAALAVFFAVRVWYQERGEAR